MEFSDYLKLAFAVIIPLLGSVVNSRIRVQNIETWYRHLKQPSFNPPDYLFIPVWITLYVSMGAASFLVYRGAGGLRNLPIALYVIQLALNWAWPSIFFGYHSLKWVNCVNNWRSNFLIYISLIWSNSSALTIFVLLLCLQSLVEGFFLLAAAIACGIAFYRVNKAAGWIFVPYVAWLSFASLLNYSLFKLNPDHWGDERGHFMDVSNGITSNSR